MYVHRDFTVCKLYHILKRLPGKKKMGLGRAVPLLPLALSKCCLNVWKVRSDLGVDLVLSPGEPHLSLAVPVPQARGVGGSSLPRLQQPPPAVCCSQCLWRRNTHPAPFPHLPGTHRSGRCHCRRQSAGRCGPCRQLHRGPRLPPGAAALAPPRQREQAGRVAASAKLQPRGGARVLRAPSSKASIMCGTASPSRMRPLEDCRDKALVLLRAQLSTRGAGCSSMCLGTEHHRRISALRVRNSGVMEIPSIDFRPAPLSLATHPSNWDTSVG